MFEFAPPDRRVYRPGFKAIAFSRQLKLQPIFLVGFFKF